jgi:Flp pilus assembly protein protease CpaA
MAAVPLPRVRLDNIVMPLAFAALWGAAGFLMAWLSVAAMAALTEPVPFRAALVSEVAVRRQSPWGLVPVLGVTLAASGRGLPRSGSIRRLLTEIALVCVFTALAWRWGPAWPLPVLSLYMVVLVIVAGTDIKCRIIPNAIVYPASIFAILMAPTMPQLSVLNVIFAGLLSLALFLVAAVIFRGAMGAGDVKLAGFIGLAVGFPAVLSALFAGVVLGGVVTLTLLLMHRVERHTYIPYGPFLAAGAALVLLQW